MKNISSFFSGEMSSKWTALSFADDLLATPLLNVLQNGGWRHVHSLLDERILRDEMRLNVNKVVNRRPYRVSRPWVHYTLARKGRNFSWVNKFLTMQGPGSNQKNQGKESFRVRQKPGYLGTASSRCKLYKGKYHVHMAKFWFSNSGRRDGLQKNWRQLSCQDYMQHILRPPTNW